MSNGVINVHDVGIYVYNGGTLTTNITGGTIRTAHNFSCFRTDFTPAGGVVEMYGSIDAGLFMAAGSLYNLTVNKAARDQEEEDLAGSRVVRHDREGHEVIYTRSNTVIVQSNFTCTNILNITSGSINLNGYTANVGNDLEIYGTLIMNNAADHIIVGDNIVWHNGCSASVTQGIIEGGGNWWVYTNTTVELPTTVTTYLRSTLTTDTIYNADSGFHFGHLVINGVGTGSILSVYPTSSYPIWITGNLSIGINYELDVSGQSVTVNGNLDLDGKLDIHETQVTVDGKPDFATTSTLNIDTGAFTFYDSSVPRTTSLRGILNINSGSLIAVNNSLTVDAGSVNTLASGNITCDGVNAIAAGTFQPAGGTVTITTNPASGTYNMNVSNGNWLPNLTLNTLTGVNLGAALTVRGNTTITDGKLDLNGFALYSDGDVTVYDQLEVDAGATFSMQVHNKSLSIQSGGRLDALGNSTSTAFFTNPPGYTNYNIESGATIAANYATFQWPNTAGVNVKAGAIIDPTYPFSNCTFKWGVSGGTLLTLDNNQNLAIYNAVFTAGGSENSNVRKTVNNGLVNFINATGTFAGESYDNDTYDRVFWTTNATPGTPDLQIVKAVYSDLNPDIGETVTCTVTFLNASTTAAGLCYVDLYWSRTSPPTALQYGEQAVSFASIPAGIPQQHVFSVTPDAGWAGTWNSYLQIDADLAIAESNETNNVFGPFNITWTAVALPAITDLTITRVVGTSNVRLNWSYPTTCTRFNIYRSTNPYFVAGVGNYLTNVSYPTMQYTEASSGKYFYIVKAELVGRNESPETPVVAPVKEPRRRN